MHGSLRDLFATIIKFSIIVCGLFIALGVLNLDKTVTSLLAGVGVIGLALGFAFQDIAANFVSGIMIAVKQPFRVGDIIEINDNHGYVKKIGLRTTKIRTFQGIEILIPNKDLFTNALKNYTDTKERRIDLACGVSYGDDLEKVAKVVEQALMDIPGRIQDRDPQVMFYEFGGSSINFNARIWIEFNKQFDYTKAKHDVIIAIKKALDANDIAIPFPIRTLDFDIKGGENLVTPLSAALDQMKSAH